MWKLTTHVSGLIYFLMQLKKIPYPTRKSLCLVHNYRFYLKAVRDTGRQICLTKQHKKYEITRRISDVFRICLMGVSQIVRSRL